MQAVASFSLIQQQCERIEGKDNAISVVVAEYLKYDSTPMICTSCGCIKVQMQQRRGSTCMKRRGRCFARMNIAWKEDSSVTLSENK